jgi:hypothetical protein
MSFATRRRILVLLLVTVSVWPAFHPFVVRALDLNPWNWWGWAMYTQPAERIEVVSYSLAGEAVSAASLSDVQQEHLQRVYRVWSRRYIELHDFAPPADFARAILEVYGGWEGVRIQVRRIGLDRASASVAVKRTRVFEYRRPDLGLGPAR